MNRWVITAAVAVVLSGTGFAPAKAAERTTEEARRGALATLRKTL